MPLSTSVSTATKPSVSPCRRTEWRLTSVSPDAQTPRLYHFVQRPAISARIQVSIQLPAGVAAFQDAIASVKPNEVVVTGETASPTW